MKTIQVVLLTILLTCLLTNMAAAQNWHTVYETDFSSDPGWTTNNSSYHYWDPSDETYYVDQINVNYGGYYAYYDAGYDGGSFRLEWDVLIEGGSYGSGLNFGLSNSDLDIDSDIFVRLVFGSNRHSYLAWWDANGYGGLNETTILWDFRTWYQATLEYNSINSTLSLDLRDRDTQQLLYSLSASGVGPFDPSMGLLASTNYRPNSAFQVPGAHTWGRFDNVSYSLEATSSLTFPPVALAPCDTCEYIGDGPDPGYVVQPVACDLHQVVRAASIPVEIPEGVEICGVSFEGLPTESWDYKGFEVDAGSGFVHVWLANSTGLTIPEGPSTLFNIQFITERLCNESDFIQWDTALSDDAARRLEFTDLDYDGFVPFFDRELNSTEILGFFPGDVNGLGGLLPTIGDVNMLIDHLFITGVSLCNLKAADVNASCGRDATISDVAKLIDYLFIGGPLVVVLDCGCESGDPAPVAKGSLKVSLLSEFEDGYTTITVSSATSLRGLQMQVQGNGTADPTNLTDSRLDLFHGATDDVIRIGMIDMDGVESIPAGITPVIRLEGEYEIISALVTGQSHQDIVPLINIATKSEGLPVEYGLGQNHPNPFNPTTEISYSLKQAGEVRLVVYNMLGQQVAILFEGYLDAGDHVVSWDASAQASGVYFYHLTSGEFDETKKMMLLK